MALVGFLSKKKSMTLLLTEKNACAAPKISKCLSFQSFQNQLVVSFVFFNFFNTSLMGKNTNTHTPTHIKVWAAGAFALDCPPCGSGIDAAVLEGSGRDLLKTALDKDIFFSIFLCPCNVRASSKNYALFLKSHGSYKCCCTDTAESRKCPTRTYCISIKLCVKEICVPFMSQTRRNS